MLNRGWTERFCGCGSFMGFAKDGHVYGLIFVGLGSNPLSSSVLGVFLDIGRDGMLKDWILAWNGGKKAKTFLWEIDE